MKTAAQLGITKKVYSALKDVRDGLANGRYIHLNNAEIDDSVKQALPVFNMDKSFYDEEHYDCGQVGCIGGWTAKQMGFGSKDAQDFVHGSKPLHDLFFPPMNLEYDELTPSQAAQAITNFLNTGEPDWLNV